MTSFYLKDFSPCILPSSHDDLISIHNENNNNNNNQEISIPKYAVGLFDKQSGSGPRKRKRLTHLTPEEKILRRLVAICQV